MNPFCPSHQMATVLRETGKSRISCIRVIVSRRGGACKRALANGQKLRQIEGMPIPVDFLRVVLGLLCVFFAHFLGRSIVRVRRGLPVRGLYGWVIRTAITGGAILWHRGLDNVAIVAFTLAAASLAVGVWDEQRPKKQEDLTKAIFGG